MSSPNSTTVFPEAVNQPDANEQPAITALIRFAAQRSGIERSNYYSPWDRGETLHEGRRAFKSEQQSIRADLLRFRRALHIGMAEGVTDADVIAEAPHAFSGRLEWIEGHAVCGCKYSPPVSKHTWASHYSGKDCDRCGGVSYRWEPTQGGAWHYCTGQYFPTEYRKAAATLLEYATRMVRQARPRGSAERIETIAQLKALAEHNGSCWFERSTMRFFGTRIESGVIRGYYFITSDKRGFDDSAGRGYSVRCFNDKGEIRREIGSVGEFYTKQAAIEALKEHLGPKGCRACGAGKPREQMIIVEGTGAEYGREFFYCSETCKEGSGNVNE